MQWTELISAFLGWISFASWSISFYPQLTLNYRRQSVSGLSLDFVYLNVFGFVAYSIYNVVLFNSETIRREYRGRNGGHSASVRSNDVAFAAHALFISSITLIQTFLYQRGVGQHVSKWAIFFMLAAMSVVLAFAIAAGHNAIGWLDVLYMISYIKLVISFIKYMPQVYYNYRRKSTVGWSIGNILLDFLGGLTSEAQLLLDSYISNDWRSIRGNPAKLVLGILAMSFDVIFICQHYVLYRRRQNLGETERQPLLRDPDEIASPQ